MDGVLASVFAVLGGIVFASGTVVLLLFVLVMLYLDWERRLLRHAAHRARTQRPPSVSVLVAAYNEERTIAASIASILASAYPDFEVIVVNDGSTDGTEAALARFAAAGQIVYLARPNGGKASALNLALAAARGDIVLFTDADTIFEPLTILNGVRYFAHPRVGAVGGNDTPLAPRGPLQKMLVITSHIGTGFVRRALSMAGILPIIPGNLGLVRTAVLRRVGGFCDLWGEDLELTLRLHRHGVRIVYGARTRVRAECPHSLSGLWKQRVRWVRSYIKVVRRHRAMLGNPRYGAFGPYLAFLSFCMVVLPLIQLFLLMLLPLAVASGAVVLDGWEWLAYLGAISLILVALYAVILDDDLNHFRYLPYVALLLPLTIFYNFVVLYSIWAELRAAPERWNKLQRRAPGEIAPDPARRRVAIGAATLATLGGAGALLHAGRLIAGGPPPHLSELAVAIHFSDWPAWREAPRALIRVPELAYVDRVAVSAGRVDWTFFKWPGHEPWWSDDQRRESADMLGAAVAALRAHGRATSAVLDMLAPRYLQHNPGYAARDPAGQRSPDIVCSTWLAEGGFGDVAVAVCAALAARTAADSIAITELYYDDFCFDERCRHSYRTATGATDWPREPDGSIDRLDPGLTRWRSLQVAGIVARLDAAARAHGKKLLVDVRVSRENLRNDSRENGQDYRLLLPRADQLVVWDYFALNGVPPSASERLARYLAHTLGATRYWHSIGLWDTHHHTVGAAEMKAGIEAAVAGGARKIWITPGRRLDAAHWRAIAEIRA